jgi:2-amino-4-hydroxy-6-hydroxymethyldihydropteridine diphosphokinase
MACLELGSNADPASHLARALAILERETTVEAVSTAWQSPAVGLNGPDYVNAAVLVQTPLSKNELKARLKSIEDRLGRLRAPGSRDCLTIDIDLLVYDKEVLANDLWTLAYRAIPVAELLPELLSPATGEPLATAAARLALPGAIKPCPEIFNGSQRSGSARSDGAHPTWT